MFLESCRSYLFVPATRPDRIEKALAGDADAVIVDLEDAVAEDQKESARRLLQGFLAASTGSRVIVRVNAGGEELARDIELCAELSGVDGIMLPKAEGIDDIRKVAGLGKPVWPLIESARGLLSINEIASAPEVAGLTFGALDLAVDLNIDPASEGAAVFYNQCRYRLVVASRACGLPAPVETVIPEIHDAGRIEKAVRTAAEMGFSGMLCIHPNQVSIVNSAFTPDQSLVEWAGRVIEAAKVNSGSFQVDGQMVDAPVINRASMILKRANRIL
ncbi:HpcH/HpaI aldolase/citrate lyase family protein [Halomonas sp. HK25]|uniref:HpcH/HpaI aldolase/citrate lyase family protein n=1 Tax=Halomonas sp. HK25 TaxID=3394321 RepID=UPI0039FC21F1